MIPLTPQQAAEAAAVLVEGITYAALVKNPAVLPGMTALGTALLGNGKGTATPQDILAAGEEIVKELGIVIPPEASVIVGLLDGANKQIAGSESTTAPSVALGIVSTVLETIGNAISAACALYVSNTAATTAAPATK